MACHLRRIEVTTMSASCCGPKAHPNNPPRWRAALWAALIVNAAMFAVELYAGAAADSHALKADALDFFGDAANYAISLLVAGMALAWRARAAILKGVTLALLGVFVLGSTVSAAVHGSAPEPQTMGLIGTLALAANVAVAVMLFQFRSGDANMRSVWICSRNDAIGNVAVVAAAAGVFGTGTAWPDLIVAVILATLGLTGGWQIIRQARGELRQVAPLHFRPAQ
jgi:Co/Zn/Cd efflux system component